MLGLAVMIGVGAVALWGRRYRGPDAEHQPPRWFGVSEVVLFLAWAGLLLVAGARHPRSGWGIFEFLLGILIAVLAVSRPLARRLP